MEKEYIVAKLFSIPISIFGGVFVSNFAFLTYKDGGWSYDTCLIIMQFFAGLAVAIILIVIRDSFVRKRENDSRENLKNSIKEVIRSHTIGVFRIVSDDGKGSHFSTEDLNSYFLESDDLSALKIASMKSIETFDSELVEKASKMVFLVSHIKGYSAKYNGSDVLTDTRCKEFIEICNKYLNLKQE